MSLWLQKQKFKLNRKQEKIFLLHFCSIVSGPQVSLAKAAAPGKPSAPTSFRTIARRAFKPDGRTVGLGGTIVRAASTAWLLNSFPPLETSPPSRHLAAVVRCKVQVTSPNGHLLSVTYLSIHIIQTERGRGEGSVGCWGAMLTNADARTKV